MAITGAKFLDISKADSFSITDHALKRIDEFTGIDPTKAFASVLFRLSRQVTVQDMRLLGYRPNYEGRKMDDKPSWYFRFLVFGQELIAVITEGTRHGEYAWVTTYGVNAENLHYRLAEYEQLAVA